MMGGLVLGNQVMQNCKDIKKLGINNQIKKCRYTTPEAFSYAAYQNAYQVISLYKSLKSKRQFRKT